MKTPAEHNAAFAPATDPLRRLTRRVVANQLLFTAGYSLTTGGFLTFFAADRGAGAALLSWVLVLPELVGMLAVLTPLLISAGITKKRLFLSASLVARVLLLAIPASVLLPADWGLLVLLVGFATSGVWSAIAFAAYLSWLSDLAPEQNWGRFFARRNIAQVATLIVVPFLAAVLRDQLRAANYSETERLLVYVGIFCLGNLLQAVSLVPLWRWPAQPPGLAAAASAANAFPAGEIMPEPAESSFVAKPLDEEPSPWPAGQGAFVQVLLFCWWLALFQGMTQTAFFLHGYRQLQLSLQHFFLLQGTMYLVQLFTTWLAGRWGDRGGYRGPLMLGTWLTGLGLVFWLLSLDGNSDWLWGAYLLWGMFGMVNLALQNLVLKVSPRGHNALPIVLYRFGSGGIAGLAGLAGGYWLDQMLNSGRQILWNDTPLSPFGILFAVSLIGRLLAPLWLIGLREPGPR